MKRKEIPTGVILGYVKQEQYPLPVIVLDTSTLWDRRLTPGNESYRRSVATRYSYDRYTRRTTGYLTLEPKYQNDDTDNIQLERLAWAAASLPELDNASLDRLVKGEIPEGTKLYVRDSKNLQGTWDEAVQAYNVRKEASQKRYRAELDRAQSEAAFLNTVRDALEARELGREVYRASNDGRVEVKLSVLAQLLGVDRPTVD